MMHHAAIATGLSGNAVQSCFIAQKAGIVIRLEHFIQFITVHNNDFAWNRIDMYFFQYCSNIDRRMFGVDFYCFGPFHRLNL